jgi:D-alanyl-lipoteichoic acid acyltransferase DltB (MBOAT superfamily)
VLFNSYAFIFAFLPVTFAGTFWLGRRDPRLAALWIGVASLVFYAAWDARFVLLLLSSVAFNYGAGFCIARLRVAGRADLARNALIAAVVGDLALLGYFKYANFFLASANHLLGASWPALEVVLPLGISFFTFTQIAFLVDAYRGIAREYSFVHYLMFVTYFPHLIAGPLYHHGQMMPQFMRVETYRVNLTNVGAGLSIFILGLAKKVLVADGLAEYANPVFDAAHDGSLLSFAEAWIGALAYTLQLYFDFSGYSDMAIGLALMFNVRLPLNFDSPYRAASIIDFWRRWHMTLSAFLRDYLYIPLGGNRRGKTRRYLNVAATMLLGGLWHGAGWTFVAWGGLHGLYLLVNHAWRELKSRLGWGAGGRVAALAAAGLTFLAVVVGWVFFRADSLSTAWAMLGAMAGGNGFSIPSSPFNELTLWIPAAESLFDGRVAVSRIALDAATSAIALGLAVCWFCPNVRQIMSGFKPVWEDLAEAPTTRSSTTGVAAAWLWRLSPWHAVATGVLLFLALLAISDRPTEFLYFQF